MTIEEYARKVLELYPQCRNAIALMEFSSDAEVWRMNRQLAEKCGVDANIEFFKEHVESNLTDNEASQLIKDWSRKALPEIDSPQFRRYLMGRLGMM